MIEWVEIERLTPNPKNPNKHSKEQIERLAEIIKYQGWRHPIIVDKNYMVWAGHGRLLAAKLLKEEKVPIHVQEFQSEDQAYAFLVSDNAIASWAELDLSAINLEIPTFDPDFDINLLGIKDFEIDVADKNEEDPDAVPETPPEAKSKLGDLFILGRHRLLCGDSTDRSSVERLMGGEKADMWITDPPYGVSYRSIGAPDKHSAIENDSLPLTEMKIFWEKAATLALEVCTDEASYYWFACQGGDQMMMMMMSISDAGWKVRHELIWAKDQMVFGRCDYHYKHEPILYGWKQEGKHNWYSDRTQVSLLNFPRPKSSDLHPTMKPVELVEYLVKNNTKSKDIIYDSFLGSGTAIIAAEKSGRNCYGLELSPEYCDVIIQRWEKYAGQEAIREDGTKWSDL